MRLFLRLMVTMAVGGSAALMGCDAGGTGGGGDSGRADAGTNDAATTDSAMPDSGARPDGGTVGCADLDCDPNATCDDTGASAICVCDDGFTGDGETCTDVDECTAGTDDCDADATCTNTAGSFTCACDLGFTGDGTICVDIDECTAGTDDCDATEICTNTDGGFTCACPPGTVSDGTTCVDVNECTAGTHDCGASATCTNTAGSFTCACNSGFTGDGRTCTDVNECTAGTHDCGAGATCTNTAGSFTCACNSGFTGDGRTCTDIDECRLGTDTCSASAACVNTAGAHTCRCLHGFTGDGTTCSRGAILVYTDSGAEQAEAAVTAMGYTLITANAGNFAARFDAGGFQLIIWDAPGTGLPADGEARLTTWVNAGNPLVFSWWQLDSSASMRTLLGIATTTSFDGFRPVHRDPAARVNLFEQQQSVPNPLSGTDRAGDNGDALTVSSGGWLAARFDTTAGPGAIAVTRSDRVIVNGFLPWDVDTTDADTDGIPDMRELYMNQIAYLLSPRVLVYHDSGDSQLPAALRRMGWTSIFTTSESAFQASFDTSEIDVVVWDSPGSGISDASRTRLVTWISGGRPTVFGYWQLNADPTLQSALQVSTVTYDGWRNVHDAQPAGGSFFTLHDSFPSPLTGSDEAGDNGDALTPTAGGTIAARLDSTSGPGAIVVTRSGRTIVNGFLPWDARTTDNDADSVLDVVELFSNEMHWLMLP